MSARVEGTPDALAALMAYVAQVRDRKLSAIHSTAEAECKALLRGARARARAQVRQAVCEARDDAEARIARARAAAQSRLRRARQGLTRSALASVRARVESAVAARWAEPGGRAAWIDLAFAEAARHLPPGRWVVSLPDGAGLPRAPALRDGVTIETQGDPELGAGLRIACGDAGLDATVAGLLRDESRIAALWLGEVERLRPATTPGAAS